MIECESELPDFGAKVNTNDNIGTRNVLKQLKDLYESKLCGPDNCHSFS